MSSRAEAYQSIIMLMGSQQLYTRWHGQAKVSHMSDEEPAWTYDTASQVLEAWKSEFTKVCRDTKTVSCKYFKRCGGLIVCRQDSSSQGAIPEREQLCGAFGTFHSQYLSSHRWPFDGQVSHLGAIEILPVILIVLALAVNNP